MNFLAVSRPLTNFSLKNMLIYKKIHFVGFRAGSKNSLCLIYFISNNFFFKTLYSLNFILILREKHFIKLVRNSNKIKLVLMNLISRESYKTCCILLIGIMLNSLIKCCPILIITNLNISKQIYLQIHKLIDFDVLKFDAYVVCIF